MARREKPVLLVSAIFLIIPFAFVVRGAMIFVRGDRVPGLIMLGFGVAIIGATLWALVYAAKNSSDIGATDPNDPSAAARFARSVARWTGQSGSL